MHGMPVALVVPPAWANHRLTLSAGMRLVCTGLTAADEAAWDVPRELREFPPAAGRVLAHDAEGWRESQLALPAAARVRPLAVPLPTDVTVAVPHNAIGVGGDDAAPLLLPPGRACVVGPSGRERDSVALRR